jgi:hypothetical protein
MDVGVPFDGWCRQNNGEKWFLGMNNREWTQTPMEKGGEEKL